MIPISWFKSGLGKKFSSPVILSYEKILIKFDMREWGVFFKLKDQVWGFIARQGITFNTPLLAAKWRRVLPSMSASYMKSSKEPFCSLTVIMNPTENMNIMPHYTN